MYWKVRNIAPDHLIKRYGVVVTLSVSILLNCILLATRPNPSKHIDKSTQEQFDQFARQVTYHLLDSSYITYPQSMTSLLSEELDPVTISRLRQAGVLAASNDEYQATLQTLERDKQVSCVRIDNVNLSDPNSMGLVPIDVSGVAATHATDSAEGPMPFHFRFLVGINKNTKQPIVASFSE